LLPFILEPTCPQLDERSLAQTVPHLEMARHIGALYAADRGAVEPFLFMGAPSAHALTSAPQARMPLAPSIQVWLSLLTPAVRDDVDNRRLAIAAMISYGMAFDAVLLYGARRGDVAQLGERGYVSTWSEGALYLGRYQSCGSAVDLPGTDEEASVLFELQVPPLEAPVDQRTLPPARSRRRVPLLRGLCGHLLLRVAWLRDGSRTVTPNGLRCEGANVEGWFDAEITREHPIIQCRVAPR
jgi:hypothetical protein